MKNKLIYIAFFIGAMVCLSSCYNDNGNYDYISLPDVKITTDKDAYAAEQFQTLEIAADVDLAGDSEADYEYTWRLWSNDIKRKDYQKEKVIGNEKNLSFKVEELAGLYTLVFTCHNKRTNVDTFKQMALTVQGSITEGWLVLHEKDGVTDFDLIKTPFFSSRVDKDIVLRNLYAMNGEQLEGRGVRIGSFIDYQRQYVTIMTDKGGAKLEGSTMQKIFDMSSLMTDGKPWNPQNYIWSPYKGAFSRYGYEVMVNDGRVYIYNTIWNFTSYVEPIQPDGLTYRASKYMPRFIWGSYYGEGIVIYDDLNGRFLYVDKQFKLRTLPDATGYPFDWNNMHGNLIYMDMGFKNHDLGLIEDWDTHKKTLYEVNFDEKKLNLAIVKQYPVGDCPEMDNAKYYAIGERGPVFYYATDKKIYLYDYSGTHNAKEVYALSNANEKITGMKILKANKFGSNHPYSNKVLILSTYNESTKEGKVYMYYFNESNGIINLESEHVFTGFGEVLDMEYNWPKIGS